MQNFALLMAQKFGFTAKKLDDVRHTGRWQDQNHPSRKHDGPPRLAAVPIQVTHSPPGSVRRRDRRPQMVRDQAARRQVTRNSRRR